jgi:hypothetical protein
LCYVAFILLNIICFDPTFETIEDRLLLSSVFVTSKINGCDHRKKTSSMIITPTQAKPSLIVRKQAVFFFFCKIFSLIHIFSYFTDLGFGAAQNDTLPVIRAVGGTASDEGGAPRATLRALPSLPLLLAEADGVGEVEVVDAAGGFS